jgi:O-methyltransferase involved in polyketide biosynthesis
MDYSQQDFIAELLNRGLNQQLPTFFLWEGNTFYLKKEIVLTILKNLHETFTKLILSFDFMHPQIADQAKIIDAFAKRSSPFQTFFTEADIQRECQKLNLSTYSHFTTDVLAKDFELDKTPYHTAKPYSVTTVHSKGLDQMP